MHFPAIKLSYTALNNELVCLKGLDSHEILAYDDLQFLVLPT